MLARGRRATEASRYHNQGELYSILKELGVRGQTGRKDGGKVTVGDIDAERESWKRHFAKVSEGRGRVADRVWGNIPVAQETATWLGEAPTDVELDKCVSRMGLKKAPGMDKFTAEVLKFGGTRLRRKIYKVVKKMWARAIDADHGHEGEDWPSHWRKGVVIPLWKRKGKRTDKNTYRGITLLSVGSKLLARVVAMRLNRWSDVWVCEEQCSSRRGRGVDDSLMVTRRLAEEVNRSIGDDWVLASFFDIEKAFPRVARDALWELLDRRGCDKRMIKVCRALHEFTDYCVRVQGGLSSEWQPDRGLREGCPSSPPLFNIYHDAVMQDFRERRKRNAEEMGVSPGIDWQYKVD
eukprot:11848585-Karenia_brevis.AAC.1